MRICYLCADRGIPLDGHKGAAAHVRGFVRALGGLGHDVRVLAAAPGDGIPGVQVLPIRAPEIVDAVPPLVAPRVGRALGHVWTNVAVERALRDVFADFQPDLVYERYSPFSVAGALITQRAGVAHVLEVNAPLAWEGSRYRKQAMADAATALEQAAFTAAPLIVAVSEELRGWLMNAGVAGERIAVVPNGVDTALFSPAGPRRRIAPEQHVVIGFAGSLKPWHGLDVLADTYRQLAQDPRFHLIVIGDGPEAPLMQKLAADFPQRVLLTGALPHEQVAAYLRGVDIAVAPYPASLEFYFSPLKVLEYMAAGTTVVASDIGQLRTLIRHGETGILTPAGDRDALARAVRELADAPEQRSRLARAAAAEAALAHSWTQRVTRVLELAATSAAAVPARVAQEVTCSP